MGEGRASPNKGKSSGRQPQTTCQIMEPKFLFQTESQNIKLKINIIPIKVESKAEHQSI